MTSRHKKKALLNSLHNTRTIWKLPNIIFWDYCTSFQYLSILGNAFIACYNYMLRDIIYLTFIINSIKHCIWHTLFVICTSLRTTLVRFLVHFCQIRIGKYCTLGLILKRVQLRANEVQLSTIEQHQLRKHIIYHKSVHEEMQ